MEMVTRMRKNVRRDEPVVVDKPTDIDANVVVADAVSEGTFLAEDRSAIGRDTKAQVFVRSRSSQATGEIEMFGQGKSGVMGNPLRLT